MTEERRAPERVLVGYLQAFWAGAQPRVGDGRRLLQGAEGIPGTRIDLRTMKVYRPVDLREWRQALLDGMGANDDHALLVMRKEGREVGRWEAHMPLRQLGIPLYGEDAWTQMDLAGAVEVLQYLQGNPRLPFLRLAA